MPLGEMSLGGSLLDDLQVHSTVQIFVPADDDDSWKFFFLSEMLYCKMMDGLLSLCLCSGGQCRPRMSAGASAAGSISVASCSGRRNAANTPTALDGSTGQSGIFPQRTQLLGQVITRMFESCEAAAAAVVVVDSL